MTRAPARLLVGLLLAVPLALAGGAGGAADAASCSTSTSGVTLVVQFPDGHTEVGCASGDPTSGLDALSRAGFSYTFPPGQSFNGFVCTLKGAPADRNCVKPSSWAYFHAPRGGSWTYSTQGAGSFDPKPGSVEGWRFESGTAGPSTKPPSRPTAAPAPAPGSGSGSGSGSGGSTGSGTTPGSGSTGTVPAPAPAPTPSVGASASALPSEQAAAVAEALKSAKASAKAAASASASASVSATPSDDAIPASGSAAQTSSATQGGSDGSGGGLPWWAGVLAVVLLGGVAGGVTLARRRT